MAVSKPRRTKEVAPKKEKIIAKKEKNILPSEATTGTILANAEVIEASAGTGKTYYITNKYVELLLAEPRLRVEQILVVTFTEAATAELRDRIRARIVDVYSALSGEVVRDEVKKDLRRTFPEIWKTEDSRARARQILRCGLTGFDEGAVFTIHGFCQRILHDKAFLTGTQFDAEVLQDDLPLLESVVFDFFRTRINRLPGFEYRSFVAHSPLYGGGSEETANDQGRPLSRTMLKQLHSIISNPMVSVMPGEFAATLDPKLLERVNRLYLEARKRFIGRRDEIGRKILQHQGLSARKSPSYKPDSTVPRLAGIERFLGIDAINPASLPEGSKFFRYSEIKKNSGGEGPPEDPFFQAWEEFAEAHLEIEPIAQGMALKLTRELIDYAREEFVARKKDAGVISFSDMLLGVYNALNDSGGERLAEDLSRTYRAALIDEFQDTDPLQFEIFRKIFDRPECTLTFVGDPKQAIYAFRGGDIEAYFSATRLISADRKQTLPENFRSSVPLVDAVSNIFTMHGSSDRFQDGGKTAFPSVRAHHRDGKDPRTIPESKPRAAFHWLLLPENPDVEEGKKAYWKKRDAEALAISAVVEEIHRIVPDSNSSDPLVLGHGDIAILVQTHSQARAVQEQLQSAGIGSVLKSVADVFSTDEARELSLILRAVASPQSERDLAAALISPLVGYTAPELVAFKEDVLAHENIINHLLELKRLWNGQRDGFNRMAARLLHFPGIPAGGSSVIQRVQEFNDAERRLTNLLHLVELLHQESIQHPGIDHLIRWFGERMSSTDEESGENGIRLESDEKRVQIVTIHSSKGLEYPVVFCPFVWNSKQHRKKTDIIECHDPGEGTDSRYQPSHVIAYLGGDAGESKRLASLAEKEHVSESIRVLYVALTRARQRCYVVWGFANQAGKSAMEHLLLDDRTDLDHRKVVGPVVALVAKCKGAMSQSTIARSPRSAASGIEAGTPVPQECPGAREFARAKLDPSWSYASYSSLVRNLSRSAKDYDGSASEIPGEDAFKEHSIFSFPAGARTGIAWHALFQRLDFRSTDGQVSELVEIFLRRNGFDRRFAPAVSEMVRSALTAPLGPGHATLDSLDRKKSVRELEFHCHFPHFEIAALRDLLDDPANGIAEPFREAARRLRKSDLTGFMKGSIDLLFEHQSTFYILDYKSNLLGPSPDGYGFSRVQEAMASDHYYLQYLIYTVAANRYLSRRVKGYSYEEHFGGAAYLFLRGLHSGSEHGVFFDRPGDRLIAALEAHITEGSQS